jgi:transposase
MRCMSPLLMLWTAPPPAQEAVARANMRFVPTKTPEQQSCLMLHRTRHLFIRQQTALINSIRALSPSSALSHRSGVPQAILRSTLSARALAMGQA